MLYFALLRFVSRKRDKYKVSLMNRSSVIPLRTQHKNLRFKLGTLYSVKFILLPASLVIIANEQAERRRSACEAASLLPREALQQAEKFSIVL